MDSLRMVVVLIALSVIIALNVISAIIILQEDIDTEDALEQLKEFNLGKLLFLALCLPSFIIIPIRTLMCWKPFKDKNNER